MAREVKSFINEYDQEIKPGDEVVVVTHCTGSTNTTRGHYVGMSGRRVQVEVPSSRYAWFDKETGLRTAWQAGLDLDLKRIPGSRITTLNDNRVYKLA